MQSVHSSHLPSARTVLSLCSWHTLLPDYLVMIPTLQRSRLTSRVSTLPDSWILSLCLPLWICLPVRSDYPACDFCLILGTLPASALICLLTWIYFLVLKNKALFLDSRTTVVHLGSRLPRPLTQVESHTCVFILACLFKHCALLLWKWQTLVWIVKFYFS